MTMFSSIYSEYLVAFPYNSSCPQIIFGTRPMTSYHGITVCLLWSTYTQNNSNTTSGGNKKQRPLSQNYFYAQETNTTHIRGQEMARAKSTKRRRCLDGHTGVSHGYHCSRTRPPRSSQRPDRMDPFSPRKNPCCCAEFLDS